MANHELVLGHGQNAKLALGQNCHDFGQDHGLGLGHGHEHDHELDLSQLHDHDIAACGGGGLQGGGRAEDRKGGGEWRMGRVWARGLDKIASGRARGAGGYVEPSWTAALASTGARVVKI